MPSPAEPFFLASPYLQLAPQNPVQDGEQADTGPEQHHRIRDEDIYSEAEISFLRTEENIRPITAAIIGLFHFRIGDQIRNLLVEVELFGRDGAGCILKSTSIERLAAIEHVINQAKIM